MKKKQARDTFFFFFTQTTNLLTKTFSRILPWRLWLNSLRPNNSINEAVFDSTLGRKMHCPAEVLVNLGSMIKDIIRKNFDTIKKKKCCFLVHEKAMYVPYQLAAQSSLPTP